MSVSAAAASAANVVRQHQRHQALSLYRSLLKAHKRFLPTPEMQALGDAYVKAEFRLHKNATDEQATTFLKEWKTYLDQIQQQHHVVMGQQQQQQQQQQQAMSVALNEDDENNMNNDHHHVTIDHHNSSQPLAPSFGKDLPQSVELTDDQQLQLEKLRIEALKLDAAKGSAGGK